jgi:hypothetical protein
MDGIWFAKGLRPSRGACWRRPRLFRGHRRISHLSEERGGDKGYPVELDVGLALLERRSSRLGWPVGVISVTSPGALRAHRDRMLADVSASRAVLQKLAGGAWQGKPSSLVTVWVEAV